VNGRLTTFVDGLPVDVEQRSEGRFGPEIADVYAAWDDFATWGLSIGASGGAELSSHESLGAPSPTPSQVFAISLNYRDHAEEANLEIPDFPSVFTKFPSSLTGPSATVALQTDTTDWELELVVVIGREGHRIAENAAWDHVAGVTIGFDISDRTMQLAGSLPQFSFGKSFPGYGPIGPWLITPDELIDRDNIGMRLTLDGEVVQDFRTDSLIFDVSRLISLLSTVVTLLPGDLIFSGTSSGVGFSRTPKRFLAPGQRLVGEVEGIGTLEANFVASDDGAA
jgi:2-keto-4-pentenoate hydratase/2-oxohepta-3-ene-1,7-dioic acid hydratase in catechol pathway